ncbi:hypothetical protein AbraIFM66950_007651 [Aspergillus brasiliensis]|nr:hypothetical protein AbraIFM66950_007651 [Aspergillus brasiliensis]
MNDISRTELASVWWYNVFYAFTAGVVLILAQTSAAIKAKFSQSVLGNAWKSCCDCLENMNPCSNTAKSCATNLQKTLSQVLDSQGHGTSAPPNSTDKPTPQYTGQQVGHDATIPGAPTIFPTLVGSDDIGSSQSALDAQLPEAMDPLWSGEDANSSLVEMLWDDLWLTAPLFF